MGITDAWDSLAEMGKRERGYRERWGQGDTFPVCERGDQSVLVRRDMKFGNELALFRVQLGQE